MDTMAVMAKVCGVALFLWTSHSIYRHLKHLRIREAAHASRASSPTVSMPAAGDKKQSVTERFLNGLLLYLWFAFLVAFSLGLVLNN